MSATQIETGEECLRKWGFKYLERIKTPQHPAAALGVEVQDTQLDPWLGEGRGFDFTRPSGEIANAVAPLLPKPKTPGLKLRRKFLIPSPTGRFGYQGEFDLYATDSGCVPGLDGGRPLLGDIKTTGNLDYAKTPEKLAVDIQAQLYSMAIMYEERVDELDAVWFYSRTRKPYRALRHHLHVTASHVVEQFQRIDAIADRLVTTKLAKPPIDELKPNPLMCEAYGGCPFRHRCNLSPAVHAAAVNMEAIVNGSTNDFLAKLRNTVPGAPPAAAPAPAPAPAPVAAPVPASGYLAPPGPFPVQPMQVPAPVTSAHATVSPGFPTQTSFIPAAPQPAPEALPAWATKPLDPVREHIAAAAFAPSAVVQGVFPPPAINPPESALPPAPPVGIAQVAPATEPKKRGRKPKAPTENTHTVPASACTVYPSAFATPTDPESTTDDNRQPMEWLAEQMKHFGIKRIAFAEDGSIREMELAS